MSSLWKKKDEEPARHADPDEAIARYLDRIQESEGTGGEAPAAALHGLGDAYFDKGDLPSAVDYYRQAAEAYAKEGLHNNAIACCKKIRRHAPQEGNTALLMGRFYAAKGLEADAVRELGAYAERQRSVGDRKAAIAAVEEIVRIDPKRAGRRVELAELYLEEERETPAITELRAALTSYQASGDAESVERVRQRLEELDAARSEEAVAEEGVPAAEEAPTVTPAAESDEAEGDLLGGLEIERTSYVPPEKPEEPESPEEPEEPEELEEQETPEILEEPGKPEGSEEVERTDEPIVPGGLEEAAAELERAAAELEAEPDAEPEADRPESLEEMMEFADRAAAERETESAARLYLVAAEGFREEERWTDALAAYRKLAGIEHAGAEDFEEWVECARQTERAPEVLEALAAAARWHLRRGDNPAARRSAEEMLLVDPNNDIASRILERAGSALPPD